MGYEQLAESVDDLEKLAASLNLRIDRKGAEKDRLEEELLRVQAKIKALKEKKP